MNNSGGAGPQGQNTFGFSAKPKVVKPRTKFRDAESAAAAAAAAEEE